MALFVLMVTFFALEAGNYGARTGLVHLGGYLGLVTAALGDIWPAPGCARPRTGVASCRYGRSPSTEWEWG